MLIESRFLMQLRGVKALAMDQAGEVMSGANITATTVGRTPALGGAPSMDELELLPLFL